MTTPKVSTIKRGGSRFYVHPEQKTKVPGVTSILDMLPKPFLKPWAAKVVAECAVEHLGEVVGIAMKGDKQGAIDYLKRAPDRDTRQAADVGTEAHDYFETMAKGETVGRVHPEMRPYVDHFDAFLQTVQPRFVFMEETVWSEAHDYAGSFDALAEIDGELAWLDWKTTRSGVHEEVALQLKAYGKADYIIRPDGSRVPLPKAQAAGVLHVRPEGWALYPVRHDDVVFDYFLHLREVFRWEKEIKETVFGDPMAGSDVAPASRHSTYRAVTR